MLLTAVIFIVLGVLIKYGKLYFLIAGYNTLSKEEQEKYDIEGIATVFRNAMFVMALIILIGFFAARLFEKPKIENYTFWIALGIGIPYLLIKSNSKEYKIKS